jgi:hypothetical protein
MEGSCEHGNELSGSIKFWEILELLHNWRLLKKGSAPWVRKWVSEWVSGVVYRINCTWNTVYPANQAWVLTRYWLELQGIEVWFQTGVKDFLFTTICRAALGTPSFICNLYQGLFSPGVKQREREDDHSPASIALVKNEWICTSSLHISPWRGA